MWLLGHVKLAIARKRHAGDEQQISAVDSLELNRSECEHEGSHKCGMSSARGRCTCSVLERFHLSATPHQGDSSDSTAISHNTARTTVATDNVDSLLPASTRWAILSMLVNAPTVAHPKIKVRPNGFRALIGCDELRPKVAQVAPSFVTLYSRT